LLRSELVVVYGSRHGTPFDSVEATNTCLLAHFTDRPAPRSLRWHCDGAPRASRRLRRMMRVVEAQAALKSPEFGA
jgi:hypothetical protein